MQKQKPEVSEIIYHPEKAGKLAVQFVQDLYDHKNEGIPLGLPDVDKILVPLRAGWLVTVIGYTSNLKSTFMDWIGLKALETIPPESNKFVCKVTWEQSVEEDTLGWIASKSNLSITRMARGLIEEPEWDILRGTATKRAATPLWVMGHSQMEFKAGRRARPCETLLKGLNTSSMTARRKRSWSRPWLSWITSSECEAIRRTEEPGESR
jgi:replicative DNA helicase